VLIGIVKLLRADFVRQKEPPAHLTLLQDRRAEKALIGGYFGRMCNPLGLFRRSDRCSLKFA